jgi:hypothetical protein
LEIFSLGGGISSKPSGIVDKVSKKVVAILLVVVGVDFFRGQGAETEV